MRILKFRKGLAIFVLDEYNIIVKRGNNEQLFTRDKEDIFTDLDDFIECSINDYLCMYNKEDR